MNNDNVKEEKDSNNDNDSLSNDLSRINSDSSNGNTNSNKKKKTCLYCLKEVEGSSRCSKCRTALYCNKDCQVQHWPSHKNICLNSNNEDSNEKLEMKATNHFKQGN